MTAPDPGPLLAQIRTGGVQITVEAEKTPAGWDRSFRVDVQTEDGGYTVVRGVRQLWIDEHGDLSLSTAQRTEAPA